MKTRILSFFFIISWIPAVFLLVPLPPAPSVAPQGSVELNEMAAGSKISQQVIVRPAFDTWSRTLIDVSLALSAGCMGVLRRRGWSIFAFLASLSESLDWWVSVATHRVAQSLVSSPSDVLLLQLVYEKLAFIRLAINAQTISFVQKVSIVYFDLLMPVLQMIFILVFLALWVRQLGKKGTHP
jgi:hypothetical protein